MSRVCDYSGKGPSVGKKIVRRGKAKREGGIGQKVTGITKRRWLPNLQTIRIIDENGTVRRVRVCARYIKAGKFTKAPSRKLQLKAKSEGK
ncbi:MAG: 50S ribosomal protein L28 [Candidatus Hydrogenedentota bacterium]